MKITLIALSLLSICGCKVLQGPADGSGGTLGQRVIRCGSATVQACGQQALPAVLGCLDSGVDVKACLLGLGSSGLSCLAVDSIACMAREQRDVIPSRALTFVQPTEDQLRRSRRAAEYLERTGAVFDDGR